MNIVSILRTTRTRLFRPSTQAAHLKFWLIVLVVLLLPLGQLPQQVTAQWLSELIPSLSALTQIRIYPHDVLIGIWMLILLFEAGRGVVLKRALSIWKAYRVESLAVVWLICSVALASVGTTSMIPILYLVRLASYGIFIWSVYHSLKPRPTLLYLVLISLAYLVFLAGVQYLFIPDIRFLSTLGWDDHYYRAAGTLFDPNFLGSLTVFLILGLWSVRSDIPKALFRSTIVIALIVLILTYSRASFLALLVAGGYLAWKSRAKLRVAILPLLVALSVLGGLFWMSSSLIGGEGTNLLRTRSISARMENTLQPLTQFSVQDWLIGQGVFVDSHSSIVWIPDNLVIFILSGMGIVGLILWSSVAVRAFLRWRHQNILIAIWISVLTHAQFNNTLLEPFHMLFLGLLTAGLLLKTRSSRPLK